MSKLEPTLQQAVAAWRTDVGYAESGEHPSLSLPEAQSRRVTVIVTFEGDIAALRGAGMETGYNSGGVVSGRIAFADLEQLAAVPGVISIAKEPEYKILLDGTVGEMRVPWKVPPTTPWPGKGAAVIVAVIDTGIDIFHDSFRDAGGKTRILELWDQTAGITGGSAPPATFAQQGRVYSSDDIKASLEGGPVFPSTDTNGHGTHVAGIAAGNGRQDDRCSFPGRYVGVAPEADLVIVKAIGVAGANVRDALRWCAEATARLPGNKPVVINCSFGSDTGPHDGTSESDKRVDDLLRPAGGPPPPGLAIVVAAGNAGRDEIHESGTVAPGATTTLSFYIPDKADWQEADTSDELDIWYNGTATLDFELIAPPSASHPPPNTTGPVAPTVPGTPFSGKIGGMTISIFSANAPMANHNNRKQINVAITTLPNTSVRPGVWQFKLTHKAGPAANWDAWFETKHKAPYPTFRLPTEVGAKVPRRRENTIDAPGTSRNAITVASYDDENGELADSSSRGSPNQPATTPVGEFKPTFAAPGVGVAAPRSRNDPDSNSSCCDQKVIDKSGTSMAAPHVTGLVALMLQKNRSQTFEDVRRRLQHSTRIDRIPSAEIPPVFDTPTNTRANSLWGSGKADAAAALTEVPAVASGGGGGGGAPPINHSLMNLGYTPHNFVSRLGDWQNRFGPRPGLMLFAALVSEHVDEVLRLLKKNRRVGAVWRRAGGPLLVRRLLNGPAPTNILLPSKIAGCDSAELLGRFLPILDRFGGSRLKADIARFRDFVTLWPGADLACLDEAALKLSRNP